MGITDEEGKTKTRPDLRWHHSGIARLGVRLVRVGFAAPFLDGGHTGLYVAADRDSSEINTAVNLCVSGTRALIRMRPVCGPVGLAFLRMVAVDTVSVNGRGVAIGIILSAYAALDSSQGGSDTGGLAVGREEVVNDVLDEDPLAL